MTRERIDAKTPEQILAMRRAGLVVAAALEAVRAAAAPGVSGLDLDRLAESVIREAGARPNFLGYEGYPASICLSVDDVVVHGIPGRETLRDGMVVSVDCGAELDGWHGDAAITFGIGAIDPAAETLIAETRKALWAGIAAMATGRWVRDIGAAVSESVHLGAPGLGVLEDYVGHGIGREMHTAPDVPNYPTRHRGPRLCQGAVLAIEPMVVEHSIATRVERDGWTVRTKDRGRAAHWEHTVARTDKGVWVLTAPDGGASDLAGLNLPLGEFSAG
jgi:methionyl aminopeptidase